MPNINMSNIKLYGNRLSGHAYKVALFLVLTKTPYEYEEISLSTPRPDRPALFRQASRYNEVPALVMDGKAYVQSNAILLHLAQTLGLMDSGEHHAQIREWLMWEQSRLGSSLPNLRFEMKFKTDSDPAVQAWLNSRLLNDLEILNTHLATTSGFMAGSTPTIADCAIAGYLYWLGDVDLDIADWPEVAAWLDRIRQLEGWQHPDELLAT